jgi:MSHA biogenesis protein MshP
MKRNRTYKQIAHRGFSLVTAIFILVVLASLGIFIVTIGEAQRSTGIAATQGSRAYHAAQSGIEWGVYQVLNTVTRGATPGCGLSPASTAMTSPASFSVDAYTVSVTCTYWDIQEGAITGTSLPIVAGHYYVYLISSTATFGSFGTRDYFTRTLQTTVTDAP